MRTTTIAILFVVAAVACASTEEHMPKFLAYMKEHKKTYGSVNEFALRFKNFKASLERIAAYNSSSAVFGLTMFSDMSPEEFQGMYLNSRPSKRDSRIEVVQPAADVTLPTSYDWRQYNAVSAVKNQAQCGSCWAFSATEEIESMYYLKNKTMPILSPQQIVSCDSSSNGCNGGQTTSAYNYVVNAGGIESAAAYPYTSGTGNDGTCEFKASDIDVSISGYTYAVQCGWFGCSSSDMQTLQKNLVSTGPVSICVDAKSWQDYTSGIIAESTCSSSQYDMDHCVQLTGYDASGSQPYWWVRNSWTTKWGIQGYIKVAIANNACGVANEATFATIA